MTSHLKRLRLSWLALALCSTLASAPVWATPVTDPAELATLAERNRQEHASCLNVTEAEQRRDCLWDAKVAYAHAKRHRASDIDPPFAQNVMRRCDALKGDEQRDCQARMSGQGTTSGSVREGGIYRELIVIETGAVPMPATPGTAAATQ